MIRWSPNFAYAVGLITTDGCLSKDGRHIDFTSKDLEQIQNFRKILKLKNKIGLKSSGTSTRKYYHVQFGNIKLYKFLLAIGLSPAKSKTINELTILDRYFPDFLRGCLDGDGYTHSYWDTRWKSSFMMYIGFVSASRDHLNWLSITIERLYGIKGRIKPVTRAFQLKYAKHATLGLLKVIYYKDGLICLKRKYLKIQTSLGIINS